MLSGLAVAIRPRLEDQSADCPTARGGRDRREHRRAVDFRYSALRLNVARNHLAVALADGPKPDARGCVGGGEAV